MTNKFSVKKKKKSYGVRKEVAADCVLVILSVQIISIFAVAVVCMTQSHII